jgi:D-alanyl-D-alanine carboxypeptidase
MGWSAIRNGLLGMACALALGPGALAQTELPKTPAGEFVGRWIAALNDRDPEAIVRIDPRGFGIREESGGIDLIQVESSSDSQVVALVRNRLAGNYLRMTWMLGGGETPSLTGLRGQQVARPADAPPIARLDDAALGGFVRDFMERADFAGAVLVARNGRPVVTAVRGLGDREAGTPISADSRFRVGSMNKMFTATAILQLVQAGKVRLDAPIGTYLRDYPNQTFAKTVTVHHLLTHTGGAGDIFGPQFAAKRLELKTLKDYVALYGSRGSEFEPGTSWRYANYGFILLGRIVEEVSGQSYPDYVRDHIFKPAGMTGSGYEPEEVAVPGRTKGYLKTAQGLRSNADTLPYSPTSAGGGYSTVRDLLAFATALTGHKLLDAEHTRLLTTRKANGNYAYGFEDDSRDGMRLYGHSGGAPGMNGDLRIVGDGQLVVVALTNVTPPGRASQLIGLILDRATYRTADGRQVALRAGGAAVPTDEERFAAFKAADANRDARLDAGEFAAVLKTLAFPERQAELTRQRDKDGDGFISEAEYRPPATLQ